MTTAASGQQPIPHQPPSTLALRGADQGVASALKSILSDNTRRVYGAQFRYQDAPVSDGGGGPDPDRRHRRLHGVEGDQRDWY